MPVMELTAFGVEQQAHHLDPKPPWVTDTSAPPGPRGHRETRSTDTYGLGFLSAVISALGSGLWWKQLLSSVSRRLQPTEVVQESGAPAPMTPASLEVYGVSKGSSLSCRDHLCKPQKRKEYYPCNNRHKVGGGGGVW